MTEVAAQQPVQQESSTTVVVTETIESNPVGSVLVVETSNGVTPPEKTNGNSNIAATAPATNGTPSKKMPKAPKVVAPPEPPKNIHEDPVGWVKQQVAPAVHKVNHRLLQWVHNIVAPVPVEAAVVVVENGENGQTAEKSENKRPAAPGKNEKVTRSQFLAHLQDGSLLAQLANKLAPGSVEAVHEGEAAKEKEKQVANIEAFRSFAKEKAGMPEEQVFSVADLQEKGKAGYDAVFNTLAQIGLHAQEKFNQASINVEQILEDAKAAAAEKADGFVKKILQNVQDTLKKIKPSSSKQQIAQPEENKAATAADESATSSAPAAAAAATSNGVEEVQEQITKVEVSVAEPTVTH